MLAATDTSIRGIRDRALLLVAYDTLYRRSELITLRVKDIKINTKNGIETSSILLRRSKKEQDAMGKWLHLNERTQTAFKCLWLKTLTQKSRDAILRPQ